MEPAHLDALSLIMKNSVSVQLGSSWIHLEELTALVSNLQARGLHVPV